MMSEMHFWVLVSHAPEFPFSVSPIRKLTTLPRCYAAIAMPLD